MLTNFKHDMEGRAEQARNKARAKALAWLALRKQVLVRDRYQCRVCGSREDQLDVYHVRLRSAGGRDVTSNLAALCRPCHNQIHLHKLVLRGDADKVIKVTR